MNPIQAIKSWAAHKILRRRDEIVPIIQYPDERLSLPNEEVNFETSTREERLLLLRKMIATLNAQPWGNRLGIAAPQIGINLRVCIVMGTPMFNPVFTAPKSGQRADMVEGCYSLPQDALYKVDRAKYGWVKWLDIDGRPHEEKFQRLKAIVAQHEISHLDGKCCNQLGQPVHSNK